MKAARQIRSSDLGLILPSAGSAAVTSKPQQSNFDNSEYADILGADESKLTYSADVVDRNIALQSEVVEFEQLLETTSEVQLEGVRTQRSILESRNKSSLECLNSFDMDYRCPVSSHFNKDKIIELLELDVQVGELMKNLKVARRVGKLKLELGAQSITAPPALEYASPTTSEPPQGAAESQGEPVVSMTPRTNNFDNASSAVSSARSLGSGISALPAEVVTSVTKMEELLSTLHRKLPNSEAQSTIREDVTSITQAYFSAHVGGPLGNAIMQLNAMAFADVMQFIKAKVNSMNVVFEEKLKAVEDARQEHEAAASTEPLDIIRYESSLTVWIEALESALKVNADRLNQLMMNGDSEGNFRSTYESTSELIKSAVVEQRETRTILLKEIDVDLKKLKVEGEKRFTEAEKAFVAYEAWREESNGKIHQCSVEQDALWEKVEALVAQIGDLGKQRAAFVREHQANTEKEYQRRRFYDEFVLTHKNHTAHLTTLKEMSVYTLKMLDQIDLFYEHMTTAIEAKNFEEGLHDMKQSDQKQFVQLYATFVGASAELLGRRSARKLLAARTARVSESLLQVDPLAPDRDHHKAVISQNLKAVDAMTQECENVAVRVEKWSPLFESVVEQLESGVPLTEDPRSKCQEAWDRKMLEIRDAVLDAVSVEAQSLGGRETEVQELQRIAAEHESRFRSLRQNSPPRKKLTRESRSRKALTSRSPRPQ